MSADVATIRSFNRTITRRIGALNERYLGRDRPLVESRLLFEIGTQGAALADLRERLGLDSGFASRLLRGLERKGLARTQCSGADRRARFVRLTRTGKAELRRIDALSDDLARSILAPLQESQRARLLRSMVEIDRLLRVSAVEITPADYRSSGAQACLTRYFDELAERFPEGHDRRTDSVTDREDFRSPRGSFFVAWLSGEPVGCGAIRTLAPGVGEIKRLWVSQDVRGLGIGRKLLEALERVGREYSLQRMRLDTHESLTEAMSLYRSAGYREISRFNDNPYARHWFEKSLI